MAAINFFADDFGVTNLSGSGLGFFGLAFGDSVDVGEYQDTTFITNGNGTTEGPQVNNIKYIHPSSGSINGASPVNLNQVPNYLATLNPRFTHSTAVKVQNVKCRIYDRSNINAGASGVVTKVAEIIHPDTVQNANGSGDPTWITPAGSSVVVPLAQSPGISGLYAGDGNDSTRDDMRHDWYLGISATPDSIGSKTNYALYLELEYL